MVADKPTSPSRRFAMGPSLSPLKGGEGKFGGVPYAPGGSVRRKPVRCAAPAIRKAPSWPPSTKRAKAGGGPLRGFLLMRV